MADKLTFRVMGQPKSKLRARSVPLLKCNACGRKSSVRPCKACGSPAMEYMTTFMSTPQETVLWGNLCRMTATAAMADQQFQRLATPVEVHCTYHFAVPKTRAKHLAEGQYHTQKPDLDNLQKIVLDSILNLVFSDDCTVVKLSATKHWTHQIPCTIVEVWAADESYRFRDHQGVQEASECVEGREAVGDVRPVSSSKVTATGS